MGVSLKLLALLSVAIIFSSGMLMVEFSSAQSISKPSIPEFTVRLISSTPENQSVNKTIELSIKNQPSVSFFNVRMRVNDGNWSLLYPNNNSVPAQSNDPYTILLYTSGYLGVENQYNFGYTAQNLSAGDKVDFQVQAMVGRIERVFNPNFTNQLDIYPYVFKGETSQWSTIQTVTIPETAGTSTLATPIDYSRFILQFVLVALVIVLGAILVVYYFRKRKPT